MLWELGQIPGGTACLCSTVSVGTLEILGICSVTGNTVLAGGDLSGWNHLEDSWTGWLEAGLEPSPGEPVCGCPPTWLGPPHTMAAPGPQMTFPAAQGSENKADTLWPLVTYPLLLYSVGQKATSPPGFTRRGRRAQLLLRGVSKNLWPCLKTTLTLKQVNQLALSHLHQLTTGFPKAESEKWSLKQGKICLGRLVTSATVVCGWERQVWANTGPLQCPEL